MAPRPAPLGEARTLSMSDIGRWAIAAGFTGDDVPIAIAVAIAESGGRTTATHRNANGSIDYGVWQINSVHAQLFEKYPAWWTADNAKMARDVFNGAGWTAWTVYRSGAYRKHMEQAKIAALVAQSTSTPLGGENTILEDIASVTIDPMIDVANALKSVAGFVFKSAAWLAKPENWVRVAYVAIGGALVIGSLVLLTKPTPIKITAGES